MDPDSPSHTYHLVAHDEASPEAKRPKRTLREWTVQQRVEPDPVDPEAEQRKQQMRLLRASFPRASRMARASDPTTHATKNAQQRMFERLKSLQDQGFERASTESGSVRLGRVTGGGGKGPNVVAQNVDAQTVLNHLVALKSKDLDSNNSEPAFLLGGFVAPMLYDRLAEASLRSNANNSSVTNRKKTESASSQTPRISCKAIGQAASAQIVSTALVMAEARRLLRERGADLANPVASNAVNVAALALCTDVDDSLFAVTSSSRLVYNANPAKLSSVSVIGACVKLARAEMEYYKISVVMGSDSHMLRELCAAVVGDIADRDPVWSCWVLVTYMCSHPRGRDILRDAGLTDVDIQAAICFERYGSEEIRKRSRQQRSVGKETERVLVQKRKRTRITKSGTVSGASDSYLVLSFWHTALPCRENSVLLTLAAHNKSTAKDAALSTLARQSDDSVVASHMVLKHMSQKNAVKSASALVSFVGRKVEQIPALVAFRAQGPSGKFRTVLGMMRIHNEVASSALHACCMPPPALRPKKAKMAIAWSVASRKLMPRSEASATMAGVLERMHSIGVLREERSASSLRTSSIMQSYVDNETNVTMPTYAAGTTRSFISIVTRMPLNKSQEAAALDLADEGSELLQQVEERGAASNEMLPSLLDVSRNDDKRTEALCTPAPQLALAIGMNESVRRWMMGKSRKGDHCLKHLGFASPAEQTREVPPTMSCEPLPLLTITDFGMEVLRKAEDGRTQVALGLHVCGDGAVRVPEMVKAVLETDTLDAALEARAALLVASSQASFIGTVGPAISCGYANASISSSKKITVPDVTRLALLSATDCYVSGLNNLHRSFDNSSYSGVYGAHVCSGFTMPGFFAHNYRSDKRQHGAPAAPALPPPHKRPTAGRPRQATARSARRWPTSSRTSFTRTTTWLRTRSSPPCRCAPAASRTTSFPVCTRPWTSTARSWSAPASAATARTRTRATRSRCCPSLRGRKCSPQTSSPRSTPRCAAASATTPSPARILGARSSSTARTRPRRSSPSRSSEGPRRSA